MLADPFAAFATVAAPAPGPRFTRPPDVPYPDAGLARLLARPALAPPQRVPVADPGSIEERAAMTDIASHYDAMAEAAVTLDQIAAKRARLELALADPALTDQYPDDSDERDAGEERLRGLEARWGDALNLLQSHAAQINHLLDGVAYEAAVREVRGWAEAWREGDAVYGAVRGNANVMGRRWWLVAVGLASTRTRTECPF